MPTSEAASPSQCLTRSASYSAASRKRCSQWFMPLRSTWTVAAAPPVDDATTLSRAMLGGNLEAAVACCLRAGRMADALVLAASGGPELWTATRDKYLQTAQTPFMRMLGAVVHEDFAGYVGASSLATWRETLALLNTYAGPTELSPLCNQLGDRLHAERGDSAAATLCYMCAANIAKVTELWQSPNPSPSPS